MIKLIASDIDGTLIEESTPDLYPEMAEEIRSLRAGRPVLRNQRKAASQREKRVPGCGGSDLLHCGERRPYPLSGKGSVGDSDEAGIRAGIVGQLRALGPGFDFVVSTPQGSLIESKKSGVPGPDDQRLP